MINLDDARQEQLDEVCAKYAITSLENAKEICDGKQIDINKIVKDELGKDVNDEATEAFILGTAIAIKKDTKLASYVALDIGEGIQTLCEPESAAGQNHAGVGIGNQASLAIRDEKDQEDVLVNYAYMLEHLNMSKEELIKVISKISAEVEEAMKEE